jgi:drug/metabolite transporter (DMT)-like permease
MRLHEAALAASILITPFSQVLLRLGAKNSTSAFGAVMNLKTLLGYAMFGAVAVLVVYALQSIPLQTVTAWDSLAYVLTPLAARWLLKDPLTIKVFVGTAVIMLGILVFNW